MKNNIKTEKKVTKVVTLKNSCCTCGSFKSLMLPHILKS